MEVLEPETATLKYTLDQMNDWGFRVVYGRWLIDGYPNVVLFDIGSAAWKLDAWKHEVIEPRRMEGAWFNYNVCTFWYILKGIMIIVMKVMHKFTKLSLGNSRAWV